MERKCCLCGKRLFNEVFNADEFQKGGICCADCFQKVIKPTKEINKKLYGRYAGVTQLNGLRIKNWSRYQKGVK